MDDLPRRRQYDHEIPDWAIDLMRTIGELRDENGKRFGETSARLSRIEGIGVGIAGVLSVMVALVAAHVI